MKKSLRLKAVFIIAIICGIFVFSSCRQKTEPQIIIPITNIAMKLSSAAFDNNANIPSKYTCDGQDAQPPLTISDVPTAAKSLALIVDDPDAPAGDWVHWLVWNIKPDTKEIAENNVPQDAMQGTTSSGKQAWGGPCPPSGVHHYQFKLYALDTVLDLPASGKKGDLEKAISSHLLDSTMLVGLYQRK